METEHEICKRYEAEFAAIAALDRRYYLTPSASLDERRKYAAPKAQMEEMRLRFYAELAACRERGMRQFRRCRSLISKSRRSGTNPA
jgi:hypothetical protein